MSTPVKFLFFAVLGVEADECNVFGCYALTSCVQADLNCGLHHCASQCDEALLALQLKAFRVLLLEVTAHAHTAACNTLHKGKRFRQCATSAPLSKRNALCVCPYNAHVDAGRDARTECVFDCLACSSIGVEVDLHCVLRLFVAMYVLYGFRNRMSTTLCQVGIHSDVRAATHAAAAGQLRVSVRHAHFVVEPGSTQFLLCQRSNLVRKAGPVRHYTRGPAVVGPVQRIGPRAALLMLQLIKRLVDCLANFQCVACFHLRSFVCCDVCIIASRNLPVNHYYIFFSHCLHL